MLLVIFFLGIIKMFCMYQGKHNFQKKKTYKWFNHLTKFFYKKITLLSTL